MASFGKTLMDLFYAKNREALAREDYEGAIIFSTAEDLVNAVHHGLHSSEWFPRFITALTSNMEGAETPEAAALWLEAIETAEAFNAEVTGS